MGREMLLTGSACLILLSSGATDQAARAAAIDLPAPQIAGATTVSHALANRRSVRAYAPAPLTLHETSQLLWAAQGTSCREGLRTAPSAGALYPLETYLVAGQVKNLAAGIYRYLTRPHRLQLVSPGDHRAALATAALGQHWIATAPAVIVFTAVASRTTIKYGARAARYIHMEVGHAAQNLALQAVALDLGSGMVGAFDDHEVARLLGLAANEEALYIVPAGRPAE